MYYTPPLPAIAEGKEWRSGAAFVTWWCPRVTYCLVWMSACLSVCCLFENEDSETLVIGAMPVMLAKLLHILKTEEA